MNKWYKLLTGILMLWLVGLSLAAVFNKDIAISEIEKRGLKQKPEFSLKSLFLGEYTKEYEEYFADQFPARERFMSVNRQINRFYYFSGFGEEEVLLIDFNPDVEKGGESLARPEPETELQPEPEPDTEAAVLIEEEIEDSPKPDPQISVPAMEEAVLTGGNIIIVGDNAMDLPYADYSIIAGYSEAITNIGAALGDGVTTYSILTPNSGEFYSPEAFHSGSYSQKDMIDAAYGAMFGVRTVDVYSKLKQHADEYIFFRTDHHWTQLGAYYAYEAFCESAGFEPVPLSEFETGVYETFLGTMYNDTASYPQSQALYDNPDYLQYYLPVVEAKARYYESAEMKNGIFVPIVDVNLGDSVPYKYLCYISGDTPLCVISTEVEGPSCILIKESYGNAFVPFLTSHYKTIYVIDAREFNKSGKPSLNIADFAAEHGVDEVLILNYPFVINNYYYIPLLDALIE